MPTMMSALSLRLAGPFAVAALFASVGFAGVTPVRAEEAISTSAGDMVLVPVKTMEALEQRVLFLEESVAALTESWQHIDTHRICVADNAGAETCITKAQLDALLAHPAQAALPVPAAQESTQVSAVEGGADPAIVAATAAKPSDEAPAEPETAQAAGPQDGADPAVVATTASVPSEPAAVEPIAAEPSVAPAAIVTEISSPDAQEETTGSVQPAITGAAVSSFPHVEVYEEPVARTEE